jgi:hypothetical protein
MTMRVNSSYWTSTAVAVSKTHIDGHIQFRTWIEPIVEVVANDQRFGVENDRPTRYQRKYLGSLNRVFGSWGWWKYVRTCPCHFAANTRLIPFCAGSSVV